MTRAMFNKALVAALTLAVITIITEEPAESGEDVPPRIPSAKEAK